MLTPRQRINITLSPAVYDELAGLAEAGGYKNVCAFVRDFLTHAAKYAAARRMTAQELARQPTPIGEEIAAMFADLLDWDAATPAQQRAALFANEKHNEL